VGRFYPIALAALLALTTALAGVAGCGDWKPAPEARLSCCAKAAACPMRSGQHAHGGPAPAQVSQASADACCAASDRDEAAPLAAYAPPAPTWSASALALALAQPLPVVAHRAAPVESPPPRHAPPRHLLLAVFLI
jgi:hypothetical protein